MKVLWDALCNSYYEVEANCKIALFEEMQEYKPLAACSIVLGRVLGKGCGIVFGGLGLELGLILYVLST